MFNFLAFYLLIMAVAPIILNSAERHQDRMDDRREADLQEFDEWLEGVSEEVEENLEEEVEENLEEEVPED
jgi:ABC-type transport system involved in cytochrome bd biosynthesis fused ATPase/permease subunit